MRRWGPGPVFVYEWKVMARRWQPYALRAAFVSTVLAALAVAWWSKVAGQPMVTAEQRGQVGVAFYGGIVVAMLGLVLAVAPAVTCGAICRDKARGHLESLLISDLTDAEIVLGKLLAWLAPAVGLVIGVLPVAAIASVIGGIDPLAMAGAVLVALGLAVLGSTLALTLSVWGTRPSEVLLGVYAIWVIWMLSGPAWLVLSWTWPTAPPPLWFVRINPFDLCAMPYWQPKEARWTDYPAFLGACLVASGILAAVASRRIRPVAVRQMGGDRGYPRRRPDRRRWLGPALDRDPIAWRERRRSRPSAWMRALLGLYAAVASAFSVAAIAVLLRSSSPVPGYLASYVNAFQVAYGLPLLGLGAVSALAEERDTGSIDLLLVTPVTTREIVRAKWWAVARQIPWFLALPSAVLAVIAWRGGVWAWAGLVGLLLAAQGAALVSLGLAIATWIRRLSLALGLYVVIVASVTLGLGYAAQIGFPWPRAVQLSMVSPFYAAYHGTEWLADPGNPASIRIIAGQAIWAVAYVSIAALLLLATRASFGRCLGRASERGRSPRPGLGRRSRPRQTATGSASGSASMYS